MSHDQRPGKMRVVGRGGAAGAAAAPGRRRGDLAKGVDGVDALAIPTDAGIGNAGAGSGATGLPMLGILLFLLGCATGGVILTLLGVFA